jgi:hypothetical protein
LNLSWCESADFILSLHFISNFPNPMNMNRLSLITILMLFSIGLLAQITEKHVVFLKNKDNNPYSLNNPTAFLTQRSLDRRTKSGIALDMKDLPVTPSYVQQIAATGAPVVYSLKWFNAVVVQTNDVAILQAIAALPFVDHLDMVALDHPNLPGKNQGIKNLESVMPVTATSPLPTSRPKATDAFSYGQAYNQAHMIAVDGLHNLGFSGEGMVIAVLDAGFYHVDQIDAFDSLWTYNRILGTRDFHVPGNNVFGDNMHTHGTSVLSTMGANVPEEMVGTAPHAHFWLVRTEVGEYEALVEEYNWAAGAEFADSVGADIINSSLGYTTFDNYEFNHTYADMDGNTTPVTRAADLAASRGILVVNSAGNEGGSAWQYIGAPADGDSVFSIGAVDAGGNYASFSSTGPTSDGRTKPDVTAQGAGTTVVYGSGLIMLGSGTSFSSPVTAGGLACLWQSRPSFSAQDIRSAVRSTASKAGMPDQLFGWGIPNLVNARLYLNTADQTEARTEVFRLTPNPFTDAPSLRNVSASNLKATIELFTVSGQTLSSAEVTLDTGSDLRLTRLQDQPAGIYFIRIQTGNTKQVLRAVKL